MAKEFLKMKNQHFNFIRNKLFKEIKIDFIIYNSVIKMEKEFKKNIIYQIIIENRVHNDF